MDEGYDSEAWESDPPPPPPDYPPPPLVAYMEPTLYVATKKGKKPEHKVRADIKVDSDEVGKVKGGETVLVTGEAYDISKDGAKVQRLRLAVPMAGVS